MLQSNPPIQAVKFSSDSEIFSYLFLRVRFSRESGLLSERSCYLPHNKTTAFSGQRIEFYQMLGNKYSNSMRQSGSNRHHGPRQGGPSPANRYSRRFVQPVIPKSASNAKFQIKDVLARWGFIQSYTSEDQLFVKSIKEATVACFNRQLLNWDPINITVPLPDDIEEAMRFLLNHSIKQVTQDGNKKTVIKTTDVLMEKYGVHMPFPPFNPVGGEYKVSRAYKSFKPDEIHPLRRFSYSNRDVEEYLFEEFSADATDEFPAHFVRSLCIYDTVKKDKLCLGCDTRGSILWNSSLRSDFCHLVCQNCNSVYTLSSVASSEKVYSLFDKRSHFRGSYAHYHEVKHHIKNKAGAKMFFIFATRSCQGECDNELPVYVAEINGAAPNLNTDCFNPDRIRIKSNVVFEPLLHQRPWFKVIVPPNIPITDFSVNVFYEYFDQMKMNGRGTVAEYEKICNADRIANAISELNLGK